MTQPICTGNCTPVNEADLIDYAMMKPGHVENNYIIEYNFDVTSLLDRISRSDTTCPNLVFKLVDNCDCESYVSWYGATGTYSPKLSITYNTDLTIESTSSTHKHNLGR